ncbi:conserved domain protein [Peptoniphilus sp. oral taxon 375 str. F0436]|nr:conserved domain protein [Peptoniphilus sp. oral taxon 375 str. F0436]
MVSMELIESLKKLEPFGVANPQPSFGDLNLKISNLKILGKNKNVIKFFVHKDNFYREAILFEDYKKFFNRLNESYPPQEVENLYYNRENNIFIDLVYKPSINEFNQQKTIQLVIESYRYKGV